MAELSKVIVLDVDPRAGRQVAFGFGREGIAATCPAVPLDRSTIALPLDTDIGLVVIGGGASALPLVAAVRAHLTATARDLPILFVGMSNPEVAREAMIHSAPDRSGADESIAGVAFLRDVVTLGRLLAGTAAERRHHIAGQLGELTNVFTLVRALSRLGRSATLTLTRGLRRGEVRFFHGEVTSCELGLSHGQAAFHQLLLWTEARFDFRHEDIVRRQQIPLSREELLIDAEHFLAGIRESSGGLSPSMVLEQDAQRLHGLENQIPMEVSDVLDMFDGVRVLADVLEDSPYRVFETLRVVRCAVEAGLLRGAQRQRPKTTWRAVLAIEEWLVRSLLVATVPSLVAVDWGVLMPRALGNGRDSLSGIVPAAHTSGEIARLRSSETEREAQPSVVLEEQFRAEAQEQVRQLVKLQGTERILAEANARRSTDAKATELVPIAIAETDDEEAFFRGGDDHRTPRAAPQSVDQSVDMFDDLDEGYQHVGFWDRLIGKRPKKP